MERMENRTKKQPSNPRPESTPDLPPPLADDRFAVLAPYSRRRVCVRVDLIRHPGMVPPAIASAFRRCRSGLSPWPLMIIGPPGIGKTRFALLTHDWYGGRYCEFAALCDEFRLCKIGELRDDATWTESIIREPRFRRDWAETRLAILDDIGARGASDHSRETLGLVLNERDGPRPLILISNLDLEALAVVFDDRLASRMAAGTVVLANGPDRRVDRSEIIGA